MWPTPRGLPTVWPASQVAHQPQEPLACKAVMERWRERGEERSGHYEEKWDLRLEDREGQPVVRSLSCHREGHGEDPVQIPDSYYH